MVPIAQRQPPKKVAGESHWKQSTQKLASGHTERGQGSLWIGPELLQPLLWHHCSHVTQEQETRTSGGVPWRQEENAGLGLESQPSPFSAVCSGASLSTSLSFSFTIRKIKIINKPSLSLRDGVCFQ